MSAPKKIAVAGATGRVGRHLVDILEAQGHEVAAMSRSRGVDVITGEGLAEALSGAQVIVDAATGPSPDEQAATEFFTAAGRNLQEAGEQAGVERIVVVSIIGSDRFTGGYGAAKIAHEQAMLSGPIPARVLRAAQFHEFVAQLMEWGARGDATYVPKMRTQLVAARSVAEVLADLATTSNGDARGRSSRSPAPARSASSRWRRCSRPAAATRRRSKPPATRATPTSACTRRAVCSPARTPSWPARRSRRGSTRRPEHYPRSARSASPRRSSAPAIHGSASGSSAPSASQRCSAVLP